MNKKITILILVCLIMAIPFKSSMANTFHEKPLTLYTTYTLNKGEWRIPGLGLLGFYIDPHDPHLITTYPNRLEDIIDISYGLTSNLSLGTKLLSNFLGYLNIYGKYHFLHFQNFDVATWLGFGLGYGDQYGVSAMIDLSISWRIIENISIHSHGEMEFLSDLYTSYGFVTFIDLGILDNTRLLAGLELVNVSGMGRYNLDLSLTGVIRLFNFLNLSIQVASDPVLDVRTWLRF